ncbi:MAG: hypothetical protein ACI959_001066 [Limisphaerales bacterium]|jgi:hypothetical protein
MRTLLCIAILTLSFHLEAQVATNVATDLVEVANMNIWAEPDPSALGLTLAPVVERGERKIFKYSDEVNNNLNLQTYTFQEKWNGLQWSATHAEMDVIISWYNSFGEPTETMPSVLEDYPVKLYTGEFTTNAGEKVNAQRRVAITYDQANHVAWLRVSYTAVK